MDLQQIIGGVPILYPCLADVGQCSEALKIGVFNGLVIALVAIGYTLVYGILQLINFANGDVFMTGSELLFVGVSVAGLSAAAGPVTVFSGLVVMLLLIMTTTAIINASIEKLAYRPLRGAPTIAIMIAAIGMSFVLENIGQIVLGPSPRAMPELIPTTTVASVGPLDFQVTDIVVVGVTIPLLVALSWFVRSTKQGKAMRACAQDREAAGLMGINVNRTISVTFLIAGALAGGAGVIVALFYGQAWWYTGFPFGMLAFTAAVLGGIGNLNGAALGGLLLGIIRALNERYVDPRWTDVVVFSILILVLVAMPSGLFGSKQEEGR